MEQKEFESSEEENQYKKIKSNPTISYTKGI